MVEKNYFNLNYNLKVYAYLYQTYHTHTCINKHLLEKRCRFSKTKIKNI